MQRYLNFGITIYGLLALLIGLFALTGIIFDIPILTTYIPSFEAIRFNTALLLTLLSIYTLLPPSNRSLRFTQTIILTFSLALSILTLFEFIFGTSFGIDELFIPDVVPPITGQPGRMSIFTAIVLSTTTLSIILQRYLKLSVLSQLLCGTNLFALAGVILEVLYSTQIVSTLYQGRRISIVASIGIYLLNLAVLFGQKDTGFMKVFSLELSSSRMARKLLPTSVLALVAVGYIIHLVVNRGQLNQDNENIAIVLFGSAVFSWLIWRQTLEANNIDAKLRETNEHIKLMVEYAPGQTALFDEKMHYVWANQEWLTAYKIDPRNYQGKSHYDLFPDLPERWKEVHERGLKGEVIKEDEDRFVDRDGKVSWLKWKVSPWMKPDGTIGGLFIFSEDITDKKTATERQLALERSMRVELEEKVLERTRDLELQSAIISNMTEGVCLVDPKDGSIIYANPRFADMFGYSDKELEGRPVKILNYESGDGLAEEKAQEIMRNVLEHGEYTYELQNLKKNGTVFWTRATTSVFNHARFGKILLAVQQDVDTMKRTEFKRLALERKYRQLVESAYDSNIMVNRQGEIVFANNELFRKFGYQEDEILGQPVEKLIPERFRKTHVLERRDFQDHPTSRPMGQRLNIIGLKKNGSEFPVDVALTPVETEEGTLITAIIRDITERKLFEKRQDFLAMLGEKLGQSMDESILCQTIASMTVPEFCDAASISLYDGEAWRFSCGEIADTRKKDLFQSAGKMIIENYADDLTKFSLLRKSHHEFEHSDLTFLTTISSELSFSEKLIIPLYNHNEIFGTVAFSRLRDRENTSPKSILFSSRSLRPDSPLLWKTLASMRAQKRQPRPGSLFWGLSLTI